MPSRIKSVDMLALGQEYCRGRHHRRPCCPTASPPSSAGNAKASFRVDRHGQAAGNGMDGPHVTSSYVGRLTCVKTTERQNSESVKTDDVEFCISGRLL